MNVAGLTNLAFAQKPQNAVKGGASKDPKGSAFEGVLSQTQRDDGPKAEGREQAQAKQERTPTESVQSQKAQGERADGRNLPPTEARASQNSDPRAEGQGLQPGGLPGQGLPGTVNNPLQDRVVAPALGMNAAAKAALLAQPDEAGVDSLTRRVVWNDFLRKMKDEFGVSAEDVLQAFGSLSDEDLIKPPAETVDKVVMALGLTDQQAVLAKQYFQDLIQKTQSQSLGEELSASSKQINLSLMSERELQRKTIDRNLNQMNTSFFMNGQKARPAAMSPQMPAAISPSGAPQVEPASTNETSSRFDLAAVTGALGNAGASAPPAPAAVPMSAPAPMNTPAPSPELSALANQMQPATDSDKSKSVDDLIQKFMQGQTPSALAQAKMHTAAAAAPAAEVLGGATASPQPASAPIMSASAMNGLLAALQEGGAEASSEEDAGDFSDASYLNGPVHDPNSKLNGPIANGADFQAQLGQVKPGAPMEVPDLVQQAQVMVHDGGGEMKVTLTPEGMGEVAMKVSVEQGKVSVQMITESDEAKKLIERHLNELKASLGTQNLQVNDIKIDTATNLGKQLEQQYQDAQRQMAQASWEQFRQDNQGWRRSFFDTPSARQYKGQAEAPRDVQGPNASSASRGRGSRRLDLVA